jgi:hypothetical protein
LTDQLLKGLAAQVANMAKTELRYRHELNGILASYHEGEGLHRMRKIELMVQGVAGKDWLNHDHAKDMLFAVLRVANLRHAAGVTMPDALVIATAGDAYLTNDAYAALSDAERAALEDLLDRGETHRRDHPKYFDTWECLSVVSQSADRVCIYHQKFERGLLIGEPKIDFFDQSQFSGRLKLYGVDPPPEVLRAVEKRKQQRTP